MFFQKSLPLCMVSIQEWFVIKSRYMVYGTSRETQCAKPEFKATATMVAPWSLPDVTTLTVHSLILNLKLIFRKDSNRQVCRVFFESKYRKTGLSCKRGRPLPAAGPVERIKSWLGHPYIMGIIYPPGSNSFWFGKDVFRNRRNTQFGLLGQILA